jgi:hypothetical protein
VFLTFSKEHNWSDKGAHSLEMRALHAFNFTLPIRQRSMAMTGQSYD